jgi:hypothetical protein
MRDREGCDDSDRGIGSLVDQTFQILRRDVDVDIHISVMFVPQNGSPDGVSKNEREDPLFRDERKHGSYDRHNLGHSLSLYGMIFARTSVGHSGIEFAHRSTRSTSSRVMPKRSRRPAS